MSPRKRDARLQVITFAFTLVADYFLLFTDDFALGVIIFWGAHLTAILRYRRQWRMAGVILVCIGMVSCLMLAALGMGGAVLYVASGVYTVLIVSVTVAAFMYEQGRFGDVCSRLGMILFLCCDVNLAIFNTTQVGTVLNDISAPLMWTFYLPAQILLSLSAAGQPQKMKPDRM
jgi:hypothetical protein